MIGPTRAVRVMVATKPVDFRKGAEGLAALVRETMRADPFHGAIYVFRAKRVRCDDGDERGILEDHRKFRGFRATSGGDSGLDLDWGDSHPVALFQPVGGVHAAAVHPHLAAAQNAVDVAAGHSLADPEQEIVHALAGVAGVHLGYRGGRGLRPGCGSAWRKGCNGIA